MSEQPRARAWRFYLTDMISFCEKVLHYTHGLDRAAFGKNDLVRDASLRNIELIGEAATHIPQDVRDNSPGIAWRLVVATRNRLIHGYLGIDDDIVWSIVQDEIPRLLEQLQRLHQQLGTEEDD
ncbi:HepT-like ribonuclease domain-containing protein [Uliginosibacterium sp. H1]|uniref:HepT-like ribonuclease domain-containing protein n=1 Tax=Uliginosibacterium sp. H1 TaxID=3114757 RepID=UPI002E173E17|nr:DUF86 domain-containing protein [Uliginosibacterium sp. H1]